MKLFGIKLELTEVDYNHKKNFWDENGKPYHCAQLSPLVKINLCTNQFIDMRFANEASCVSEQRNVHYPLQALQYVEGLKEVILQHNRLLPTQNHWAAVRYAGRTLKSIELKGSIENQWNQFISILQKENSAIWYKEKPIENYYGSKGEDSLLEDMYHFHM